MFEERRVGKLDLLIDFFLIRLFLILGILGLIILAGCGGGIEDAGGVDNDHIFFSYWEQLPQEEEINASIYAYELILKRVGAAFSSERYLAVLTNYHFYRQNFFESEVEDESALDYYLGKSLLKIFGGGDLAERGLALRYLRANRGSFSFVLGGGAMGSVGRKEKGGEGFRAPLAVWSNFTYYGAPFEKILVERKRYKWEKLALMEVGHQKFYVPVVTKAATLKNLEYFYWLVTRYPDLPYLYTYPSLRSSRARHGRVSYREILGGSRYFRGEFLTGEKERERLARIRRILSRVDLEKIGAGEREVGELWAESFLGGFEGIKLRPYVSWSNRLVVRSRADEISSRNLAVLQGWEPFWVLYFVEGERKGRWARIIFRDQEQGFARWDNIVALGLKSYDYFLASKVYYQKDYIGSLKILSSLLPEVGREVKQMGLILFYKGLMGIALRSTSQENPYMDFAIRYPNFFSAGTNMVSLEVNQRFFPLLFHSNFNSPMLQYY